MRSPFKFPRRVRIHGGECDAVARALHHEAQKVALTQNEQTLISDECVFSRQADLGKVPSSTNERKQMSTKTTLKRIALVAVSALGFGLLSSVPSMATVRDSSAITIGTGSMKTGVFNYIPVTFQLPSSLTVGTDTVTVNAQITGAPTTGGNANAASVLGTGASGTSNLTGARFTWVSDAIGTAITSQGAPPADNSTDAVTHAATDVNKVWAGQLETTESTKGISQEAGSVSAASAIIRTSTANTTSGGLLTVYLAIKPDLAGNYSVLVSTNTARRTYYSAGDQRATATFATTGDVASITMTALNTAPLSSVSNAGVVYRVTLKDSAGNATGLGALDQVQFTSNEDRKSTRLNSSHVSESRMPSSA